MLLRTLALTALAFSLTACSASQSHHTATPTQAEASSAATAIPIFEGLELATLSGGTLAGDSLKGKVVLVVNVASQCGYTGQYAGLQELYKAHKDKGLVVLGVPCNQFGRQEPGTSAQITSFVSEEYGVSFPLLAKQEVKGANQSPLFKRLIGAASDSDAVGWNFEKFLVGRDGRLIERYSSGTSPDSKSLERAITAALQEG